MKKYFAALPLCFILAACSTPKQVVNPSQVIILANLNALYEKQVTTIQQNMVSTIENDERSLNKNMLEQQLNKVLNGRRALPKSETKALTVAYANQLSKQRALITTEYQEKLKQLKKYYLALVTIVKKNDGIIRNQQADNNQVNELLSTYQSGLEKMISLTATNVSTEKNN